MNYLAIDITIKQMVKYNNEEISFSSGDFELRFYAQQTIELIEENKNQ